MENYFYPITINSLNSFLINCANLQNFNKNNSLIYISLYKNDISITDSKANYLVNNVFNSVGIWWNIWSADFKKLPELTEKFRAFVTINPKENPLKREDFINAIRGLENLEQQYSGHIDHYFIQNALENLQRALVALDTKKTQKLEQSGVFVNISDGDSITPEKIKQTDYVNALVVDGLKTELFSYRVEVDTQKLKDMVRNFFFESKLLDLETPNPVDPQHPEVELTIPHQFYIDIPRLQSLAINSEIVADDQTEISVIEVSKTFIESFGQKGFQKLAAITTQYYDWGFARDLMNQIPGVLENKFKVKNYFVSVTADKYQFTLTEKEDSIEITGKIIFQVKDGGGRIVKNADSMIGFIAFEQTIVLSKKELSEDFVGKGKDELLPSLQVNRRVSTLSQTREAARDNLVYHKLNSDGA